MCGPESIQLADGRYGLGTHVLSVSVSHNSYPRSGRIVGKSELGPRWRNPNFPIARFSSTTTWSHCWLGLALRRRARRELAAFSPKGSSIALLQRIERNGISTFFVRVVRAPMARTGQAT